ncbi:MAG: TolC family protein [Gluconobacter cerinus]|uniref:TolC family protein n=1 Tax=Gluconobacter cerinus TaxID=38307 RepID=UPI0039EBA165
MISSRFYPGSWGGRICVLSCVGAALLRPPVSLAADNTVIPFHAALVAAWENDPVRRELATNTQSADARAAAARSWFVGGPVLTGSYYDDRVAGTNLGYITWQGGVSVPLWLPGQGSATERVAQADSKTALSRVDVERMAVAVRVLEQTGAVILSERRVIAGHAIVRSFEHIAELTARAHGHGEVGTVELQAVTAQLADARGEVAKANTELASARSRLQTLLGVPGVPDLMAADPRWLDRVPLGDTRKIEEQDPRVQSAHREVIAAQEQMRLARASFMPNPEIGVDAIDQGQYGSPWATQVGVNFRIPLPSDVTHTPQISAARDRLAASTRAEIQARRAVHDELAQVMASLAGTREALLQARTSAAQTMRRADAIEHSWTLGETPLIEALRARTDAWRSLLALNQAEVSWHGAIIRTGISTGTLP